MAFDNNRDWRLSTFNGALLASYFIPSWTIAAMKIWVAPVRGLYDRANVAPAMYVSDIIALSPVDTIRFAWMLALGKVTVALFFFIFLLLIIRESIRNTGGTDEALGMALTIGGVISFASMMAAVAVGEKDALRLHSTETLMLIAGAILLTVEAPWRKAKADEEPMQETRELQVQPVYLSNPSS